MKIIIIKSLGMITTLKLPVGLTYKVKIKLLLKLAYAVLQILLFHF